MKMGTIYLKLLLSYALICTFEKTNFVSGNLIADKDAENCTSVIPEDQLLLNNMDLENYDIQLTINLHLISGSCKILIHVFHQTKIIRLRAHKQINWEEIQLITKEEATGNGKSKIQYPDTFHHSPTTRVVTLLFENDIEPAYYYLNLKFYMRASKAFIEYESLKNKRWIYTNALEPVRVCSLFPCWDEPGITATFNITVIHPIEYKVVSNILIQEDSFQPDDESEWQHTVFMFSPLIAPSELIIMVYDKYMREHMDMMGDFVWYYSTSRRKLIDAITINSLSPIIKARMSLYKYTALNSIDVTEHIIIPSPIKIPGCDRYIIYRERDIVDLQDKDFIGNDLRFALIIGYQVGHEWIKRVIPQSSWPYAWISNSFATYYSYFYQNQDIYKFNREIEELFVVQILQPALHYDTALNMSSLTHKICDANEIDTVLYSRFYRIKGAALLHMMKHIFPSNEFEKRFGQFIKHTNGQCHKSYYYHTHLTIKQCALEPDFGNIFWETLQGTDALEEKLNPLKDKMHDWSSSNFHIRDIMFGWSQQRHYSILYVTSEDSNVIITPICEFGTDWHIPVNIRIQSHYNCQYSEQYIWMRCNTTKIIPEIRQDHFVILNKEQGGYYRVNYDGRNWRRITSFLEHEDHTCISVQNRAHLIDDAYYFATFATKDKLNMAIFLNLIRYLKRETHYIAWYPMFNILYYMSAYWKLPESKFVKPIILDTLDGLLENIGYEENPEDDGMKQTLRLLAAKWSCKLGDSRCREAASAKLHTKYISPDTIILPRWKKWVYRMGMTQLNQRTWHRIMSESFQAADIPTLKHIAFTDNSTRILQYLNFFKKHIDNVRRIEEKKLISLYRFILKINLDKDMVREYVLKHFMKITNRFYKKRRWIDLWGDIILNLQTDAQIREIKEFLKNFEKHILRKNKIRKLYKLIDARSKQLQNIRKKFSNI